jgi:Flp pilus assembly pilin Flp
MVFLVKTIVAFAKHARGATYIEYTLVAMLIAVACAGALSILGTKVQALYASLSTVWP